jgi:hypothetical protein
MFSINYFRFVVANRRFIVFGFLAAFTSSFGQTYFIGIFGPGFQAEIGLSHTTWERSEVWWPRWGFSARYWDQ